ncbi:MAG: serine hydroxymethyltransferase [Candidatus Andersenbacteria bacterium]
MKSPIQTQTMTETSLQQSDPEVFAIIERETEHQQTALNMIPSENAVSAAVREATGSVLTNKYSEGYPYKRYYQGNAQADDVEQLAIDRAKDLFGAEHVNVQPHSGSPANMAVFMALLTPGDTFMGLSLDSGGHLTHGSPVNFSGTLYNAVSYTVNKETGLIDLDEVRKLAKQHKPKMIISGWTAYPRQFDFEGFQQIASEVGAYHLADISHIAGLVAGGVHPSPVPLADVVTTTTHKTLRGPRGAMIMSKEEHAKAINKAVFPGIQGGPHEHSIAAKAVAFREALSDDFKIYAAQIIANAKALADALMERGVKLVSDGTDTHLLLIDLTPKGIGLGKQAAVALETAGIVTNANTVPFDPSTPFKPSGVRLGTPTLTTRGMKEAEMKQVGTWIADVLGAPEDTSLHQTVRVQVQELCEQFPLE